MAMDARQGTTKDGTPTHRSIHSHTIHSVTGKCKNISPHCEDSCEKCELVEPIHILRNETLVSNRMLTQWWEDKCAPSRYNCFIANFFLVFVEILNTSNRRLAFTPLPLRQASQHLQSADISPGGHLCLSKQFDGFLVIYLFINL